MSYGLHDIKGAAEEFVQLFETLHDFKNAEYKVRERMKAFIQLKKLIKDFDPAVIPRRCLKCRKDFMSAGINNRVCKPCFASQSRAQYE